MEVIIDRFEEQYAVVEYEDTVFKLPKNLLPVEAKEGDVLALHIIVNHKRTDDVKEDMLKRMNKLWE